MRSWWILGVALVACDGTEADLKAADAGDVELTDADLVDDADPDLPLPPPLPVVMDLASDPWVAGDIALLTIEGAAPGARVHFLEGTGLGSTCPVRLGGDCIDITGVTVLGSAFADANGDAVFAVPVDAAVPDGTERHLQAVVASGAPYASGVVSVVVDGAPAIEDITLTVGGGKVTRNNPASGIEWDWDPFGIFEKADPYFVVWVDSDFQVQSITDEDTRFPYWGYSLDLTVPEGSTLFIDVYDDDGYLWQGGDDYIGTLEISSDDIQVLADQGMNTAVGGYALQELEVEIVAR